MTAQSPDFSRTARAYVYSHTRPDKHTCHWQKQENKTATTALSPPTEYNKGRATRDSLLLKAWSPRSARHHAVDPSSKYSRRHRASLEARKIVFDWSLAAKLFEPVGATKRTLGLGVRAHVCGLGGIRKPHIGRTFTPRWILMWCKKPAKRGKLTNERLHSWWWSCLCLCLCLCLCFIYALFATMFKFLPSASIPWKSVRIGALLTTILFLIGKYLLAIYFGKMQPGSTYGAAGSIILIMLWVSYSSLILLFGAHFTKTYSDEYLNNNTQAT